MYRKRSVVDGGVFISWHSPFPFHQKEVGTRVGLGRFLGCHSGVMMPISTVGKEGIILHLPFSTDREVT